MGTGSVKRLQVEKRFMAKIMADPNSGCWIWASKVDRNGYGRIKVNYKERFAHRVSYELYTGEIPPGLCVCHKCDTPACVNPNHLFVGTQIDNMRDMFAKGRKSHTGENGPNARLTEADVLDIRASRDSKITLAGRYGVTRQYIGDILSRKNWAHLPAI